MEYFIVVCGSKETGFVEVGFIEAANMIMACRKVSVEMEICVGDYGKTKFYPQFGDVMMRRASKDKAMKLPEIKSGMAFRELVCVSREE